MAQKLEELYVEIRAKTDKLEKDLAQVKSKTASAAKSVEKSFSLKGMLGSLAIGLVIKKLFDLGIEAKNAARDAEETRTKFEEVFSSMKDEAIAMGDSFAKSFGLAGSTAQKLLGNTGDLLVGFGFAEDAAFDMSLRVNQLAQDLASFQNVDAIDASNALTKAMLGETEAAKRLGIAIKSDDKTFVKNVETKQLTLGLTYTQAKALQVLEEAYKQSGKAVGDFARTQDGLANQERIAAEAAKELLEQVGAKLIPIFAQATTAALDFFRSLTETDLETTIRQLEKLGASAEDIAKLQALNVEVNLETNRAEVLEDLDGIRENANKGFIVSFIPGNTANVLRFISNSSAEFVNLQKAVNRATDSTIPLGLRMSDLEKIIQGVVAQAKATGVEIQRSGPTSELTKRVGLYADQAKYLTGILVKLKSIESVTGKQDDIEQAKTDAIFRTNEVLFKQGTFTKKVAEETKYLSDRIGEETLKLKNLEEALLNLPYGATTDEINDATTAIENQQKIVDRLSGKKGGKDEKSFAPQIPEGYTAEQAAMYESLQYLAEGYVDYVTAVIEQKYINDLVEAKGNADQILQIEEDKLISLAALNQEQVDRNKVMNDEQAQSYRDLMAEMEASNKESQDRVNNQGFEYNEQRKDAISEYYDFVTTADAGYWTYREAQIQAEVDAYLLATENKLQAEILFNEKMKELNDEREAVTQAKMDKDSEDFQQFAGIMGQTKGMFAEGTAAYKAMAVTQATIATYLAAAKALETIPFPFGFIAAAAVTAAGLANVGSILAAATGGTFEGGQKVASFARGGSMTVPLGYPNDSFPVLVQSGERLDVTPANQVGEQEKLLGTLIGSVNALNMNLLNKNMSSTSNITIDGKSIAKSVYKVTKKLEDEGTNLDLL